MHSTAAPATVKEEEKAADTTPASPVDPVQKDEETKESSSPMDDDASSQLDDSKLNKIT